MPSTSVLTGWKKYQRYSDNIKVKARLVQKGDMKMMEVKNRVTESFACPHCDTVLSEDTTVSFPNFFFSPEFFHEKHKPA